MRVILNKAVAAALLAGFIYSCAGSSSPLENAVPDFSLRVLDQTYVDGGAIGKATLNTVQTTAGYTVEISVDDAQGLKALFFELDYDATQWHPVGCESSRLLDLLATPIDVSYLGDPGTVSHGQVVQHYDKHSGFGGDAVLAQVEFAAGAAPMQRKASTLGTPHNSGPVVFADYYNKFLRVNYNISGDYDQNGEVNLADIMPLSLFFGQSTRGDEMGIIGILPDGTVIDTVRALPVFYVDGNRDGEINLADLSTIAINYGFSINGFDICASPDYLGDYPFDGSMTTSAEVVGRFNLPPSTGYDPENRVRWEFPLPAMDYANHYWVHPVSGNEHGRASMVAVDLGDYQAPIDKEYGLGYDVLAGALSWNSNLRGDMDSNGQVNVADVSTMVVSGSFGSHGPFQQGSIEWGIDSNRDGVIDVMDIAIIDLLNGNSEDYNVYATSDPELVPQAAIDPEELQPQVLNSGMYYNGYLERASWRTEVEFASGTYVWVRMFDGTGREGPRSEVIQIP